MLIFTNTSDYLVQCWFQFQQSRIVKSIESDILCAFPFGTIYRDFTIPSKIDHLINYTPRAVCANCILPIKIILTPFFFKKFVKYVTNNIHIYDNNNKNLVYSRV